jgi:hypothetical protein
MAQRQAPREATLATYAEPIIGTLPVSIIDTGLVMKVLEQDVADALGKAARQLWTVRPETASRLGGRLEAVLDWAKVRGYREGENPARWRGHLDKLLPARSKVRKVAPAPASARQDRPAHWRVICTAAQADACG